MLYLEDDDAVAAETYIKKASSLLTSCKVRRGGRRQGRQGRRSQGLPGALSAPQVELC